MKYLILLVFGLLSACTPNNKSNTNSPPQVFAAKSMAVTGILDFGDFLITDSSKLNTYKITNNGTEALTGPASLSGSNFTLAYQNCNNVVPKASCSVKVSFSPKDKTAGPYVTTLSLDTVSVELSASVTVPPPPASMVKFLLSTVDITSSGLDFGTLKDNQTVIKTISIKNVGTSIISGQSISIETVQNPIPFIVSYDSCSGKDLAKNASCSIKVTIAGAGKSGIQSANLKFGDQLVSIAAQVDPSSSSSGSGSGSGGGSSGSVNLVFMNGTSVISGEPQSYDYGTLSGTNYSQLILTVKNTGTLSFAGGPVVLSSSDFSIAYNACNNIKINAGASCQIRLIFSASGKSNALYTGELSLGGKTLNLSATVSTIIPVVTYVPQYSNFGVCKLGNINIQSCDGQGQQSRTITSCRKLSDGIDIGSAPIGSCSAFQISSLLTQSCVSPAGNKTIDLINGTKIVHCEEGSSEQTFVSINCSNSSQASGFHSEDNNSCVSNTRVCETLPTNASAGSQIYAGNSWGSCIVSACAIGTLQNGQCIESLVVNPSSTQVVQSGAMVNFQVSGGSSPYIFELVENAQIGSSIGPSGIYIAGNNSGASVVNEKVKISDSNNNFLEISINIQPQAPVDGDTVKIAFTPAEYNFGSNLINSSSKEKYFLLRNIGSQVVDLSSIVNSNSSTIYSVDKSECQGSLNIGQFCGITVEYNPPAVLGYQILDLVFNYNNVGSNKSGTSKLLVRSYTGENEGLEISTLALNYGSLDVGSSTSQELIVKNTGIQAVNSITAISSDSNFTVSQGLCGSLSAGNACVIGVNYSPSSVGSHSGQLTVTFNYLGGGSDVKVVEMTGSAQAVLVGGVSPLTMNDFPAIPGTLADISPSNSGEYFAASYNSSTIYLNKYRVSDGVSVWSRTLSYSGTIHKIEIAGPGQSGATGGVTVAINITGTITTPSPVNSTSSSSSSFSHPIKSIAVFFYRVAGDLSPYSYDMVTVDGTSPSRYVSLGEMPPLINDDGTTSSGLIRLIGTVSGGNLQSYSISPFAGGCPSGYINNVTYSTSATGKLAVVLELETGIGTLCSKSTYVSGNNSNAPYNVEGLGMFGGVLNNEYYRYIIGTNENYPGSSHSTSIFQPNYSNGMYKHGQPGAPSSIKYVGSLNGGGLLKITYADGTMNATTYKGSLVSSWGTLLSGSSSRIDPIAAVYAGKINNPNQNFYHDYVVSELNQAGSITIQNKTFTVQGNKDILITRLSPGVRGDYLLTGLGDDSVVSSVNLGRDLGVIVNCPVATTLNFLGSNFSCSGLKLFKFAYTGPTADPSLTLSTGGSLYQIMGGNYSSSGFYLNNTYLNNGGASVSVDNISLLSGTEFSIDNHNCSSLLNGNGCSISVKYNPLHPNSNSNPSRDYLLIRYSVNGRTYSKYTSLSGVAYQAPECPSDSIGVSHLNNLSFNPATCQCPGGKGYDVLTNKCVPNDFNVACFAKDKQQSQSSCEADTNCSYFPDALIKCQSKGNPCITSTSVGASTCSMFTLDGKTYGNIPDRMNCGKGAHYNGGPLYGQVCECDDSSQTYDPILRSCVGGGISNSDCGSYSNLTSCEYKPQCQWTSSETNALLKEVNGTCSVRCQYLSEANCSSSSACSWNSNVNVCEMSNSGCAALTDMQSCYGVLTNGTTPNSQVCQWDSGTNTCSLYLDHNNNSMNCNSSMGKYDPFSTSCMTKCDDMNSGLIGYWGAYNCACSDWTAAYDNTSGFSSCRLSYDPYGGANYSNGTYSCGYSPVNGQQVFDELLVIGGLYSQMYFGGCRQDCSIQGATYDYNSNSCSCSAGYEFIDSMNPLWYQFSSQSGCYLNCDGLYDESSCNGLGGQCSWTGSSCVASSCNATSEGACNTQGGCNFDYNSYTCKTNCSLLDISSCSGRPECVVNNNSCQNNCSQFSDSGTCGNNSCYWDSGLNSCYQDQNQAPSCEQRTDSYSCSYGSGCSWWPDNSCHNGSFSCSAVTDSSQCQMNSCYWYSESCNDSPPQCSSYSDEFSCQGAGGCSWDYGMGNCY